MLKAKDEEVFQTEDPDTLRAEVGCMGLSFHSKPYMFSYVRMIQGESGAYYTIRQYIKINGNRVAVSPNEALAIVNPPCFYFPCGCV